MKQQAWNVYLYGRHIDTVFFQPDMSMTEVRISLIDHDGYSFDIKVRKA